LKEALARKNSFHFCKERLTTPAMHIACIKTGEKMKVKMEFNKIEHH